MAGPNAKTEYQRTVDEAVDWFAEHGFTSAEKLAYWEDRIRRAAEAAFGPSRTAEEMLRDLLAKTYEKMVSSGKLTQFHPGVARWTLEKVRPELRAELDRRIMASANLIRIKRKQRIEETLARFSGWASSQPVGGSAEPEKRETKESIKKPLASLPYENRRVLIDQSHKLVASLNEVVATGGGAIALRWHSMWRQKNYNFRPDHKERDGLIYGIRGAWAYEKGLTKKPVAGWYDEITAVAQEPFCRCSAVFIYSLRELEKVAPEALTQKGREALDAARAKIKAMA